MPPPWGRGERWAPGGVPGWAATHCQRLSAGAAPSFLANPFVPFRNSPSEKQASGFALPLVLWLASAFPGCGSPRLICLPPENLGFSALGPSRRGGRFPVRTRPYWRCAGWVINAFCLGGREGWDRSVKPKSRRGARRRLRAAPLQLGREDGACAGRCQGRERREGFKRKPGNILASLFCCSLLSYLEQGVLRDCQPGSAWG